MRYTTPEWLLDNLEKRLRIALEDRTVLPEKINAAGTTVPDTLTRQTGQSTAIQSAA